MPLIRPRNRSNLPMQFFTTGDGAFGVDSNIDMM